MAESPPRSHTGVMERNRVVAIALGAAIVVSLVLLGVSALTGERIRELAGALLRSGGGAA